VRLGLLDVPRTSSPRTDARAEIRAFAGTPARTELSKIADSYLSLALVEALQEAIPPNDGFPKAREAMSRALEIDETLSEAHATLGRDRSPSLNFLVFSPAFASFARIRGSPPWFATSDSRLKVASAPTCACWRPTSPRGVGGGVRWAMRVRGE
jgi:hypothetical protein